MGFWSPAVSLAGFAVSAALLVALGRRFATFADRLADRTGMGEAVTGAVLVGAATSLPGVVTTGVAAAAGEAAFAVSHAVGGIAAQTVFLAVGDLTYRRANLEHAAASVPNLLQALILIGLIGLVLLGTATPAVTFLRVHPISPLLLLAYVYGVRLSRHAHAVPMWRPERTAETRLDRAAPEAGRQPLLPMVAGFALMAALVAGAGFVAARAGLSLTAATGLSDSLVGGLFTAVVTSLPELVTVIAAVRIGALTLAVGNVIGGNTFDVLTVAMADGLFRSGSVYHAAGEETVFLLILTVVLTSILAAGLVYRGRRGIGFEGLALLVVYVSGFAILYATG